MYPMEVVEILKNEYGITTEKELDTAIERVGVLDISPFCVIQKERKGDIFL